ncbi:peptidase S8/S53 domain-containing protein [Paraphysoderma sedebokerense]|nr:peptidase S8/S53 domain-containing protein [Paraphysoderma sedebokerense]
MMHEASARLPKGFRAYIAVLTETVVKEISGLQGIRIVRDYSVTLTIGQQHKRTKSAGLHRRFVNDIGANLRRKLTSQNIETDFEYGNWGLDRIDQASSARDGLYLYHPSAGENVTVILVDSGLVPHDDFKDRVLPGKSFVEGANENRDILGHGSFAASLIASREVGVAKKVNVQVYQIMNENGKAQYSNVLEAIFQLSLDVKERKRISGENIVINIALGFNVQNGGNIGNDLELELLLKKLIEVGAVVVQAAGNDNVNACHHALYRIPEIIHVGAMSYNSDRKWENSNFGECVDIYAPGHRVLGYNPNQGEFVLASGTSYATPHVAGVVALYLSTGHFAHVDANNLAEAVKQTLIDEAWDVNQEILDTYNGQIPKILNSVPSFM